MKRHRNAEKLEKKQAQRRDASHRADTPATRALDKYDKEVEAWHKRQGSIAIQQQIMGQTPAPNVTAMFNNTDYVKYPPEAAYITTDKIEVTQENLAKYRDHINLTDPYVYHAVIMVFHRASQEWRPFARENTPYRSADAAIAEVARKLPLVAVKHDLVDRSAVDYKTPRGGVGHRVTYVHIFSGPARGSYSYPYCDEGRAKRMAEARDKRARQLQRNKRGMRNVNE